MVSLANDVLVGTVTILVGLEVGSGLLQELFWWNTPVAEDVLSRIEALLVIDDGLSHLSRKL